MDRPEASDEPDLSDRRATDRDRRATDEQLRHSRAFLDSIVENIPNMVFVKDAAELRFVRFNRAGENLLGYTRQEMIGKNDHDFFPEDEAVFFIRKDREVLEAGHAVDIPAEPIETRHRGQRILHTQKIPIIGDDGRPEYLLGISEDITDRIRVVEALRERQQTLDAVFEASPDAIMILTPGLRITEVSAAVAHIDGVPATERVDRGPLESVHPEDVESVERSFSALLRSERGTVEIRYRLRHAEGHWVPVEARGRSLRDPDGEPSGAVVVVRDISERVLGEQALLAARHEAEEANRAKNEFLSRMSHELRTPLNAVIGFAQLLEMELEDESHLESAGHILRAGRHLLELINDVLEISRIEAGTVTISVESVSLAEVLQECVDLVSPQAAERGIKLSTEGVSARYVLADRQRLCQVFLNLLSNAIKFNRDDGRVAVDAHERDGTVRVSVTDTGVGIADEMLERLFTPFDRLGADTGEVEGTGLGLVVSKRLCGAMGISLGVDSEVGRGSTFWIDLPIAGEAPHREAVADEMWTPTGADGHGTLLHIEDNVANLQLVEHLLRHRPGIRLIDAIQGSLGLELAVRHRPDLILLDVQLPDLSGEVVLRRLKSDPRTADIPVVMVSADATPGRGAHFQHAGAQAYLTKPLDVRRLLEVLDGLGEA